VTGAWNVYRTYAGEPERGPDAAAFSNVVSGFGVQAHFLCSSAVLPAGHVDIAGELHGTRIELVAPDATWVGTVTGASMDGELAESTGRAGTWRAQKVPAARCKTYEVWAADTGVCATDAYHPEEHGFTFIGTGTATATFAGSYHSYLVVTRDLNQVQVDAVETTPGTYLSSACDGNVSGSPGTLTSADGAGVVVGGGAISAGGFLWFDPPPTPTSIKVYVVP
jgi:hypothetical protein